MIESLDPPAATAHRAGLIRLLQDAVESGASLGFLPPLDATAAGAYWDAVIAGLTEGSRRLYVARDPDGGVAGSVQLELAVRPNAGHRAEVTRLMVHRTARRRGLGRALMLAVEAEARRLGRTTLVLDTRQGDPSERLYQALGWSFAGVIPCYAASADGTLHTTAIYYRLLDRA
jgi:GNAT superfamily N-acetyltransferase